MIDGFEWDVDAWLAARDRASDPRATLSRANVCVGCHCRLASPFFRSCLKARCRDVAVHVTGVGVALAGIGLAIADIARTLRGAA